jgi:hypothetical protein
VHLLYTHELHTNIMNLVMHAIVVVSRLITNQVSENLVIYKRLVPTCSAVLRSEDLSHKGSQSIKRNTSWIWIILQYLLYIFESLIENPGWIGEGKSCFENSVRFNFSVYRLYIAINISQQFHLWKKMPCQPAISYIIRTPGSPNACHHSFQKHITNTRSFHQLAS